MKLLQDRIKLALAHRAGQEPEATRKKINVRWLALACGVSEPSAHGWFSGATKTLKADSAIKAARHLRVRPEWLTEGKGPMVAGEPDREAATAMQGSWTISGTIALLGALATDLDAETREDIKTAAGRALDDPSSAKRQAEKLQGLLREPEIGAADDGRKILLAAAAKRNTRISSIAERLEALKGVFQARAFAAIDDALQIVETEQDSAEQEASSSRTTRRSRKA
jgi:hypothetical protein